MGEQARKGAHQGALSGSPGYSHSASGRLAPRYAELTECFHGVKARSAPTLHAIEVTSAGARSSCLAGYRSGLPKNLKACHLNSHCVFAETAGWSA